ncbi:snRNA-activating protein complex subunit 1b [Osmerus eperlanus]|uniref:snRNA-activating protein complex subunit 1b n=1 Tax=Osmerus eperlanus TaxID=29151 RepID=UPI002E0F6BF4
MEATRYCKEQVNADIEDILSRFQQTESVRYEQFSAIWKEMKFSSIFYGRLEINETRSFSRVILSTAFSYLLPPYTFQIRVGGLYLLYGLFNSQLITPREKIRLALKDWEDIKKFEQDAINAQHFDVVYIYRKLLAEKAFHFTATPVPLCFQVKKKTKRQELCEEFMDRAMRPQELVSMDMLEEVSNVHQHYEQLKTAISSTPGQPDPELRLVNKDLVPHLRNAVVEYYQWQSKRGSQDRDDPVYEDGGEGPSEQQECSRRALLLASIKSKSYGQQVEASKSRRHRQVETVTNARETEPRVKSRKTFSWKEKEFKRRIRTLKQKTCNALKLTDEHKDDQLNLTKPWCLTEAEAKIIIATKNRNRFRW